MTNVDVDNMHSEVVQKGILVAIALCGKIYSLLSELNNFIEVGFLTCE